MARGAGGGRHLRVHTAELLDPDLESQPNNATNTTRHSTTVSAAVPAAVLGSGPSANTVVAPSEDMTRLRRCTGTRSMVAAVP